MTIETPFFIPYVRAQTHIQFFPSHLIKPIHYKKPRILIESAVISETNQIKTTFQFLPNLTIPGEHHAKRKQNENRKQLEKHFLNSVLPYFWKFFPYHFTSNPFSPQLPSIHYNLRKFLRHHIIVNIFP